MFNNNYLYGREILLERKGKPYRNNDGDDDNDKISHKVDEYIAKNWKPKNPEDREKLEEIKEKVRRRRQGRK